MAEIDSFGHILNPFSILLWLQPPDIYFQAHFLLVCIEEYWFFAKTWWLFRSICLDFEHLWSICGSYKGLCLFIEEDASDLNVLFSFAKQYFYVCYLVKLNLIVMVMSCLSVRTIKMRMFAHSCGPLSNFPQLISLAILFSLGKLSSDWYSGYWLALHLNLILIAFYQANLLFTHHISAGSGSLSWRTANWQGKLCRANWDQLCCNTRACCIRLLSSLKRWKVMALLCSKNSSFSLQSDLKDSYLLVLKNAHDMRVSNSIDFLQY